MSTPGLFLSCIVALGAARSQAAVVSKDFAGWCETGDKINLDQVLTPSLNTGITLWWTFAVFSGAPNRGFFYGERIIGTPGLEVALARGLTEVSQLHDASEYTFSKYYVGPWTEGSVIIVRNTHTGYYAAVKAESIDSGPAAHGCSPGKALLNGTWYLQNDRTAIFN